MVVSNYTAVIYGHENNKSILKQAFRISAHSRNEAIWMFKVFRFLNEFEYNYSDSYMIRLGIYKIENEELVKIGPNSKEKQIKTSDYYDMQVQKLKDAGYEYNKNVYL